MRRLKNRQMSIPNGYSFRIPELNWDSRTAVAQQPSFDTLVRAVITVRKANEYQTGKHGWSTEYSAVADEVDAYNALVCINHRWTPYVTSEETGGPAPPFYQAPSQRSQSELGAVALKVKAIWSGVKLLNDWIESGEPAVPQAEAERRAVRCVACPLNGAGGLEAWFTKPASLVIQKQIEKLESRKLSTSQDERLGVCSACYCPMRLKVHTPMSFIKAHLTPEITNELAKGKSCWIIEAL